MQRFINTATKQWVVSGKKRDEQTAEFRILTWDKCYDSGAMQGERFKNEHVLRKGTTSVESKEVKKLVFFFFVTSLGGLIFRY